MKHQPIWVRICVLGLNSPRKILKLELVSTKYDIKIFCNFVTSMMIFLDQFFGRRLGRRIVTKKVRYSVINPLWYRGSISDPYAEGPGFESL